MHIVVDDGDLWSRLRESIGSEGLARVVDNVLSVLKLE